MKELPNMQKYPIAMALCRQWIDELQSKQGTVCQTKKVIGRRESSYRNSERECVFIFKRRNAEKVLNLVQLQIVHPHRPHAVSRQARMLRTDPDCKFSTSSLILSNTIDIIDSSPIITAVPAVARVFRPASHLILKKFHWKSFNESHHKFD